MKKAKSCGAVIYRTNNTEIKFFLIKHLPSAGNHWSFPKGHVEPGETEKQTALREIKEETNLEPIFIPGFRETTAYIDHVKREDKTVVFFLAKSDDEQAKSLDGVEKHSWLAYEKALKKLTYQNYKEILTKAHNFLLSQQKSLHN